MHANKPAMLVNGSNTAIHTGTEIHSENQQLAEEILKPIIKNKKKVKYIPLLGRNS